MSQRNQAGRSLAASLGETTAAFAAALARGDALTASAVYGEDATLLAPLAGPMRGRTAIEKFWQAGLAAGLARVRFETFTLQDGDSLAYEVGHYELLLRPADCATLVEHGTYLVVHALQADGSWRRAAEALSPDGPARVPPPSHGNPAAGDNAAKPACNGSATPPSESRPRLPSPYDRGET